jgi:hypothetical protein
MPGATAFDRILVLAVTMLIALFTFGTVSTLVTSATADDVNVNRDDSAIEIEGVDEDDDDRDGAGPMARDGSRDGSRNGSRDRSKDNSRSRESNTTRGTGPSNTNTRDTKTGTRTRR